MRRRAFTLTEVLIALIIVGIVGSSILVALFSFFRSYAHTEDYTVAREEIEHVFQSLSLQFSNAGLGMPNNRGGKGSFAVAFAGNGSAPRASVMSLMGRRNEPWGGPITVASGDLPGNAVTILTDGDYAGPELYYAWSVPTGRIVSSDFGRAMRLPTHLSTFENYDLLSRDEGYWSGDELNLRRVGSLTGALASKDAWIAFPSFGAPLWVKESGSDYVNAVVAPGALDENVLLGGVLRGFEEVHHVRAARLRVVSGNLVQELYETPPQGAPSRTLLLARGVAQAWFRFNPQTRILSLSLAVRGINAVSPHIANEPPVGWPANAPDVRDGQHRILVESMTWRIRN